MGGGYYIGGGGGGGWGLGGGGGGGGGGASFCNWSSFLMIAEFLPSFFPEFMKVILNCEYDKYYSFILDFYPTS
jgi:hypothetical protein